jgi:L,D-transpeptidase catalytic domain
VSQSALWQIAPFPGGTPRALEILTLLPDGKEERMVALGRVVSTCMNPVGSTWIGLGDGYGIHGTPDPQSIGKTQSHGCVHLTNWDAQALAKMVHRGTKVEFIN